MAQLAVADDVEIFYTDHGSGEPVLLLHGWACDGSDWSWLATDLAVDHRVIVVDHRGHGRSTTTARQFGAKVLADDAAQVLRALSIEHAVVIGHSMGTIVASALAVEHPELVSALVLVDPVYGQTDNVVGLVTAAIRQQPLDVALGVFSQFYVDTSPPWQRFWHERRLRGMPTAVVAEALCALYEGSDGIGLRSVGETYLGRRKCPMLAVYSGTTADVAEWERALPHGPDDRVLVWNDNGHFLHQERPEEFAALTREWLAGLRSGIRD
jgi:pimeloyl-ACP methyl ester carboxylesterase